MTEDQRKEWMRVLREQELARTIRVYNKNVRKAKVHITPAVRRSFKRGDEPAKAVVTLVNEPSTWLAGGQVEAIQVMVASAVKGLEPRRVAVIDSSGRNLAVDPTLTGEADPYSVSKRKREEDLERKLSSALTTVLGANDAIVRVSLTLDRERIESTDKSIDKGSKAISREKVESTENSRPRPMGKPSAEKSLEEAGSATAESAGSKTEKVESDFEYSTKTTHKIKEAGAIQRMSVAVFVNSDPNDPERDRSQMVQTLRDTARAAVGLDVARGDTLALELVPFSVPPVEPPAPEPGFLENPQHLQWMQWGVAALLGLMVALWFMRSAKKAKAGLKGALERAREEQARRAARKEARPGDGTHEDPSKDIASVIEANPEAVGRLLRNWMYETVK
jgi:flagellar M-ring protein FliF